MREIQLARDNQTGLPFTSQQFTIPNTDQKRLGFHFKYVTLLNRWCFDLTIDDESVMCGRTVVLGTNCFAPYAFGVGALFAADILDTGVEPGLKEMTEGSVRLYYLTEQERVNMDVMKQLVDDL